MRNILYVSVAFCLAEKVSYRTTMLKTDAGRTEREKHALTRPDQLSIQNQKEYIFTKNYEGYQFDH